MFRLCFLTFAGEPRDHHRFEHAHESPKVMTGPLVLLAVLSVVAGWWALPWLEHGYSSFVHYGEQHHEGANWLLMGISTIVALSGITLAYLMYYRRSISAEKVAARFKPIYTFIYNKWYFDELYQKAIIDPIMKVADYLWSFDARVIDGAVNGSAWLTVVWSEIKLWFDIWIVDGAVNGSGWVIRQLGGALRYLQTGSMQFYALTIVVLIVLIAALKFELVSMATSWPFMTLALALGLVALRYYSRVAAAREEKQAAGASDEKL
jgi:NADH-quinone oxidoreductase subunit L